MSKWVQCVTWLGITATVLLYMTHKGSRAPPTLPPSAVNVDEVNAERWAHDGTQPFVDYDGNRAPVHYEHFRTLLP
jgi:hypothetical protein